MIETEYVCPPVPTTAYDWMASVRGEDGPIGRGPTECEALRDLCEQLSVLWLESPRLADIARLRTDLVSCRGTVKTELNHYERLAMVHGQTPHGATYEAEAQRLSALLERIDALGSDGTKC